MTYLERNVVIDGGAEIQDIAKLSEFVVSVYLTVYFTSHPTKRVKSDVEASLAGNGLSKMTLHMCKSWEVKNTWRIHNNFHKFGSKIRWDGSLYERMITQCAFSVEYVF